MKHDIEWPMGLLIAVLAFALLVIADGRPR